MQLDILVHVCSALARRRVAVQKGTSKCICRITPLIHQLNVDTTTH